MIYIIGSPLPPARWVIEVCPHKNLCFAFTFALLWLPLRLPQTRRGHVPKRGLIVLCWLGPPFLWLEYFSKMFFCAFTDALLPPSYLNDVLGCLECLSDYLGQRFLMELCLLGQFHVIIADSLLEDSRHLLENLFEIFLELRSEAVEELLHIESDFLSIYFGKTAFHFFTNSTN